MVGRDCLSVLTGIVHCSFSCDGLRSLLIRELESDELEVESLELRGDVIAPRVSHLIDRSHHLSTNVKDRI